MASIGGGAERETDALRDAALAEFGAIMRHVSGWHLPGFLALDVTMSQAKLLHLVAAQPGIRMSALAEQLGVGLSAVSSLVDRLVEPGLLDRREDPADRRQHLVTITPAGGSVIDRMRQMNAEHLAMLLEGLSNEELRALIGGLEALARRAAAIDRSAGPTGAATSAPSGRASETTTTAPRTRPARSRTAERTSR